MSWLLESTSQTEPGVAKPEPGQPGSRLCSHPHGMPTRCDLCLGGSTEPWTAHQLHSLSSSASVLCRLLPVCQGETLPLRMLRTWGVPRTHRFHPWSWQQRSGFCSVLRGPSAPRPAPPLLTATRPLAALRHRGGGS